MRKNLFIFTSIIGWLAICIQCYFSVQRSITSGLSLTEGIAGYISYFTIWINLLIAFFLSCYWLRPNSKISHWFLKPSVNTAVLLYILIVAIIYSLLLRKTWHPSGLELLADHALHDLIPLLYFYLWIKYLRGAGLKKLFKTLLQWLILPVFYLLYVLLRGAFSGAYPYPFLRVSELGYQQVLLNSCGILFGFIAVGLTLFLVDYVLQKRDNRS